MPKLHWLHVERDARFAIDHQGNRFAKRPDVVDIQTIEFNVEPELGEVVPEIRTVR